MGLLRHRSRAIDHIDSPFDRLSRLATRCDNILEPARSHYNPVVICLPSINRERKKP
jgi:hypothetical protein